MRADRSRSGEPHYRATRPPAILPAGDALGSTAHPCLGGTDQLGLPLMIWVAPIRPTGITLGNSPAPGAAHLSRECGHPAVAVIRRGFHGF